MGNVMYDFSIRNTFYQLETNLNGEMIEEY